MSGTWSGLTRRGVREMKAREVSRCSVLVTQPLTRDVSARVFNDQVNGDDYESKRQSGTQGGILVAGIISSTDGILRTEPTMGPAMGLLELSLVALLKLIYLGEVSPD